MRDTMPREFYIPKGATKIADKHSDAVAYIFERAGAPYAMVFFGKQAKPVQHLRYRTTERREQSVRQAFEGRRASIEARAKWKTEAREKAEVSRKATKVGDIFRTCWGYDQTNMEFFEVVEVRGAYAILREIGTVSDDNGHGTERCVPQSGAYLEPRYVGDDRGKPIRRLIQDGRIKIDDVRTAWPWGERVAGVVVGDAASRTAFGWGH
jgi:hypothetical protein